MILDSANGLSFKGGTPDVISCKLTYLLFVDVICLGAFIAFLCVWIFVAIVGVFNGDINRVSMTKCFKY